MFHSNLSRQRTLVLGTLAVVCAAGLNLAFAQKPAAPKEARPKEQLFLDPINVTPPHFSTDKSVKIDYDIAYVRAPRKGDKGRTTWTEIAHPALMDPGADLMLLHPDGKEEKLVAGGEDASVTDPFVSLDGQWIYYSHIRGLKGTSQHGQSPFQGADIYKINVASHKIVQLTHQEYTPNTGAADWASDFRKNEKDKTHL